MPRDFKTFAKENEEVLKENKEKANEYQDIINKYKVQSQNQLISSLFEEASRLKKEGKLETEQLENMKSMIAPFLNPEQKAMLEELVRAINEQK